MKLHRRKFLTQTSLAAAALTLPNPCGLRAAARPDHLGALTFRPLPLGAITPEGWLQRQLRLQADGLTGHLDEFWPDVAQSQWFGGSAEGWERAPYWLDGLIPLAWGLQDSALQEKAKRRVAQIIGTQRRDGWYAPYPTDPNAKPYDLWSILLVNKVLVQYHDATGEAPVLQAVLRNCRTMLDNLDAKPLFEWGKFRWFEGLIPVYYLYEKTGETWLLDLAQKLRAQGFNYHEFYAGTEINQPTAERGKWTWEKHVVNTAMALKTYALAWRLSGADAERNYPRQMWEILDHWHGQVTGMFSGDECLAGPSPVHGTELCAVVETLYSLEHLLSVTGDGAYGDRLERIAFNALPGTFSPDMWSHQYDQQVNQVQCTINPDYRWSTNGADSNIFGLEPNYGCCTSNMHQGWPKFAAHLWMRTREDGVAAVAYAPSTARFAVRDVPVRVTLQTDYPFRETLQITVNAERPIRFPLDLRVPAWAEDAVVQVAGAGQERAKPGTFHRLDRQWSGETTVQLTFPMRPKVTRRFREAIALERGPLVYSLKLGESWARVNADKPHRELPHGDFEIRPSTPWNYGLVLNEHNPEKDVRFVEQAIGEKPFSADGAAMLAKVKGRRLPDWKLEHGSAGPVPQPVPNATEAVEELTLIPYGCAKIRVTEFPQLRS